MIFRRMLLSLAISFMALITPVGSLLYANQSTLIQADVFQDIPKLTRGIANSEWNVDLFSKPYSSALSYTVYADLSGMRHALVFVTDPCWNRIVYYDYTCDWIKAWGNDDQQGAFSFPHGITSSQYSWNPSRFNLYIADTGNDRIVHLALVYYYTCSPTIEHYHTFTDSIESLDEPYDLDLNDNATLWDDTDDYLWVVDYGDHKIKRFDLIDNEMLPDLTNPLGYDGIPDEMPLVASYGGYGSGVGKFKYPRAIINGRDWQTGKNNKYIYVADTGNNRIVKLFNPNPTTIQWVDTYEAPQGSYLVSLGTDTFGNLWVVDFTNGRILKLTSDLELITTIGSMGTGSDHFLYPTGFSTPRAHQPYENWDPDNDGDTDWVRGFADVSISEKWTEDSGGRRYLMGVDVVNLQVTTNLSQSIAYCSFTLTDQADVTVKVYDGAGNLRGTLCNNEERYAGYQSFSWDSGDEYYAEYTFRVTATSLYRENGTGDPLNTVIKEASVWTGGNVVISLGGHLTQVGGEKNQQLPKYKASLSWVYTGPQSHSVWGYYLHGQSPHRSGQDYYEWDEYLDHFTTYEDPRAFSCEQFACYYVWAYLDEFGGPLVASNWLQLTAPLCPVTCPYLYSLKDGEYKEDNNVLPRSELLENEGKDIVEYYKIENPPDIKDKICLLKLREFEGDHSYLDRVSLLAVDHPADTKVAASVEGEIVGYRKLIKPVSVTDSCGNDYCKFLSSEDGIAFEGKRGKKLTVNFGRVEGIERLDLVIGGVVDSQTKSIPKPEPVLVCDPDFKSTSQVGISYRRNKYIELVELPSTFEGKGEVKVRLYWQIPYNMDFIGLVGEEAVPHLKVQKCPLTRAMHATQGLITKSLMEVDDQYAELTSGQEIELEFTTPQLTRGSARDFIFCITGHYVKKKVTDSQYDQEKMSLPSSFSLAQNYPNPFNPVTHIRYSLPVDCKVKLEIYNILGQRVVTLVDGEQKAGYKTVRWNANSFSSGIYFFRIEAGDFTKARKMILLK